MKILIDLQCCQTASRTRGIGRYSLSLAKAIAKNPRGHDIHILLNGRFVSSVLELRDEFRDLLSKNNIHVFECPPFNAMDCSAWNFQSAHLIREAFIETISPDVVHVSSLIEWWDAPASLPQNGAPYISSLTLYDLIPLSRPEALPAAPFAKDWYKEQIVQMKNAGCILAISENARQEAISKLSLSPSQVSNISAGVADNFFAKKPLLAQDKHLFLITKRVDRPFALTVGAIEDRKNICGLVEAWARGQQDVKEKHQLVIAYNTACEDTMAKIIAAINKHRLSSEDVLFLKDCSDEELQILYRTCKLFILPSLHEGFGLPAAEAMACGAPTIGSNTTSIPEVIGLTEALFDPNNTLEMSALLSRALVDIDFREMLKKHAAEHSRRFSWDAVAQRALEAFEQNYALRGNRPKPAINEKDYRRLCLEKFASITADANRSSINHSAYAIAANRPRQTKQLLIDVTVLAESDAKTGVQRVVRNFAKELLRNKPNGFDVRLTRNSGTSWRYATGLEQQLLQTPQADLGLHYIPQQRLWLEKARSRGVTITFIVYDILPALMPKYFHEGITNLFIPWLETIRDLGDRLVCISETVAGEIRDWYGTHSPGQHILPDITFVHMGADLDALSAATANSPTKLDLGDITESTFLIVSTVEPRKGHQQLLEAFDILWNRGVNTKLVIVGKAGWNVEKLVNEIQKHDQLGKKLIWLAGASDEVLDQCYATATALISTSFGEGFGLPLIEGAQRNLPILARDIPVFREIAQEHAFYFSAEGPLELADAIQKWLSLYAQKQHPKSDQMFWQTWTASAEKLRQKICE
jgi:glycosyltransferase involved in cell wall biosynthesis